MLRLIKAWLQKIKKQNKDNLFIKDTIYIILLISILLLIFEKVIISYLQ